MSFSELSLIFIVALVVFGPKKLPMVAHHFGKLWKKIEFYRQQLSEFWQSQANEYQLQENLKKAEQADSKYKTQLDDNSSA